MNIAKNTVCLWYDDDAEGAARFLCRNLSRLLSWRDRPLPRRLSLREEGDVITVEFTVMGVACIGSNGGPDFQHNETFSFQVATEDQRRKQTVTGMPLWAMVVRK